MEYIQLQHGQYLVAQYWKHTQKMCNEMTLEDVAGEKHASRRVDNMWMTRTHGQGQC